MSKRPTSLRQGSLRGTGSACDLLVLHTCLRCEDAGWTASVDRSIDALPFPLQERILRYRRPQDRCARILAKWIVRKACQVFAIGDGTLNSFDYDERGRPSMANLHGFDFNVSHAGERVVCAVAEPGPVGVDVEQLREIAVEEFRDVFPRDAWDRVCAAGMQQSAFFKEWTRLEAVVKAEGCGINAGLREMESEEARTQFAGRTWYVHEVALGDGYACHVASASRHPAISTRACFWDGEGLHDA